MNNSIKHSRSQWTVVCICLLFSGQLKADLVSSLYQVFGGAGKAACYVTADGLALTPIRVCTSGDTLSSPTELFCRFTRNDCDVAYANVSGCLSDPLSCTQQAFIDACELSGMLCEQTYQAMNNLQGCIENGAECAWGLLGTFGAAGQNACISAANVIPAAPPTVAQCNNVYTQYTVSSACLRSTDIASCLNQQFLNNCVSAANYFPHTAEQCDQLSNLASEVVTTIEQCLSNIPDCPNDLMQQISAGVVRLAGRIVDAADQPMMGILVTAVPATDDVLVAATSTHAGITGEDGRWQIDINPAFSFSGQYRVSAIGPLHDFSAINNVPQLNYVVTVE